MKNVSRMILVLLLTTLITAVFAQAEGDYRTRVAASGNWTANNVWQQYTGGNWTDVATYPSSADGVITIEADANILYDLAVIGGIDQLVVNGTLTVLPLVSFGTADGAGNEVEINGTFIHQGIAPVMAGTGVLNSGAVYVHNSTTSANNVLNFFGTKDNNSTWIYRGSGTLTPAVGLSGRSFGNLVFESTSGSWTTTWSGGGATIVNGDFTLGENVTINMSSTGAHQMKGNYTINGTLNYGAGTQVFNFMGVNKTIGGAGTVAFETANIVLGAEYYLSAHINMISGFTFTISGTLGCGGFTFAGAGNFTLADNGTFKICHPNGIDGNVLVSGSKNFSLNANYEFYGLANQVTGASFPPLVKNLTINNDGTVSLSNTLVIQGTLHFIKGFLALGNYLLIGSGVVTGDPDIIFNGTGTVSNLGNSIHAFILTINPGNLPSNVDTLTVQTGAGNNFYLPNQVTVNSLVFTSGGLIFNNNNLVLAGKDISLTAPNNTTYINALSVTKTNSPALANGGNQSISRLWNISGNSSASVNISISWPTPAADSGISFTDDLGNLWNFTGGNWTLVGPVLITTNLGIRSATFTTTLGAKDINGDWTVTGDGQTLPVELSSFTAILTAQNFVKLTWISQSETGLLGYRVYRSNSSNQASAVSITPVLIPATNTSSTQIYSITDTEVSLGSMYYYWLESVDMGSSNFHGPVSVLVEGQTPPAPVEYTLMRDAYPNPFRVSESTNIEVSVKAGENGTVTIYNVLGQAVKTYQLKEGINPLVWNGRDNKGNLCASGVYFYKLSTPSLNQTKKMVLVK